MAYPKSPTRRRDLMLRACGLDLDDLSVEEAEWLAVAAVNLSLRRPLPPFGS